MSVPASPASHWPPQPHGEQLTAVFEQQHTQISDVSSCELDFNFDLDEWLHYDLDADLDDALGVPENNPQQQLPQLRTLQSSSRDVFDSRQGDAFVGFNLPINATQPQRDVSGLEIPGTDLPENDCKLDHVELISFEDLNQQSDPFAFAVPSSNFTAAQDVVQQAASTALGTIKSQAVLDASYHLDDMYTTFGFVGHSSQDILDPVNAQISDQVTTQDIYEPSVGLPHDSDQQQLDDPYHPFYNVPESMQNAYGKHQATQSAIPEIMCRITNRVKHKVIENLQISHGQDPVIRSAVGTQHTERKTRQQHDSFAKQVLEGWLESHMLNPYPDMKEKQQLAAASGLAVKQVATWFANARKRMPQAEKPLDRWLQTPMDQEAASLAAVAVASDSSEYSSSGSSGSSWSTISDPPIFKPRSQCSSARASSRGSAHSAASAFSQCSEAVVSGPPKRGRKKGLLHFLSRPAKPESESDKRFACTFCWKRMTERSWERHEREQHLPGPRWVCLANVKHHQDALLCVFCNERCPTQDAMQKHRKRHNVWPCRNQDEHKRTFNRKNKLVSHCKQVHKLVPSNNTMDAWVKGKLPETMWTCGFCGQKLDGWTARVQHLRQHFRSASQPLGQSDWVHTSTAIDRIEVPTLDEKASSEAPADEEGCLPCTRLRCSHVSESFAEWERHELHHGSKRSTMFQCWNQACGFLSRRKASLQVHCSQSHQEISYKMHELKDSRDSCYMWCGFCNGVALLPLFEADARTIRLEEWNSGRNAQRKDHVLQHLQSENCPELWVPFKTHYLSNADAQVQVSDIVWSL